MKAKVIKYSYKVYNRNRSKFISKAKSTLKNRLKYPGSLKIHSVSVAKGWIDKQGNAGITILFSEKNGWEYRVSQNFYAYYTSSNKFGYKFSSVL